MACIHPFGPFGEHHLIGRIFFLREMMQISRRKKALVSVIWSILAFISEVLTGTTMPAESEIASRFGPDIFSKNFQAVSAGDLGKRPQAAL